MYVFLGLESVSYVSVAGSYCSTPTPILFAEPSMPRMVVLLPCASPEVWYCISGGREDTGGIGRLPMADAGVGLSVGMRVLLLLDMMPRYCSTSMYVMCASIRFLRARIRFMQSLLILQFIICKLQNCFLSLVSALHVHVAYMYVGYVMYVPVQVRYSLRTT